MLVVFWKPIESDPIDSAIDSTLLILQEGIDAESYKDMRAFRKPVVTIHYYSFYLLLFAVMLHLMGVVLSELRERNGLVSAMLTGEKVFRDKPFDAD